MKKRSEHFSAGALLLSGQPALLKSIRACAGCYYA